MGLNTQLLEGLLIMKEYINIEEILVDVLVNGNMDHKYFVHNTIGVPT